MLKKLTLNLLVGFSLAVTAALTMSAHGQSYGGLIQDGQNFREDNEYDDQATAAGEEIEKGVTERGIFQARLHCLLIIDNDAENIGQDVLVDKDNMMRELVKPLREHRRLGYLRVLEGSKVNPARVLEWIKCIRIRRGDTIFIYYSGHGAIIDGQHYLAMSHNGLGNQSGYLSRGTLWKAIEKQAPNLGIVITDCCANRLRGRSVPQIAGAGNNWFIFTDLFFGLRGKVDINSSKPGQYSGCDEERGGGFVTNAFVETLVLPPQRKGSSRVTWTNFLNKARRSLSTRIDPAQQDPCFFAIGAWGHGKVAKPSEMPWETPPPDGEDGDLPTSLSQPIYQTLPPPDYEVPLAVPVPAPITPYSTPDTFPGIPPNVPAPTGPAPTPLPPPGGSGPVPPPSWSNGFPT